MMSIHSVHFKLNLYLHKSTLRFKDQNMHIGYYLLNSKDYLKMMGLSFSQSKLLESLELSQVQSFCGHKIPSKILTTKSLSKPKLLCSYSCESIVLIHSRKLALR